MQLDKWENNLDYHNDNVQQQDKFTAFNDAFIEKLQIIESKFTKVDVIYWYMIGSIITAVLTYVFNYINFKNEGQMEQIWQFSVSVSSIMFIILSYMTKKMIVSLIIAIVMTFDYFLTAPARSSLSMWPMTFITIICVLFISRINKDDNQIAFLLILFLPPIAYLILNQKLVGYSCLLPYGYAGMKVVRYILKKILKTRCTEIAKFIMVIVAYIFMYLTSFLIHIISGEESDLEKTNIAEIVIEAQSHCPGLVISLLLSLIISGIHIRNSFIWLALLIIYIPRSYKGDSRVDTVYKEMEIALLFAAAKSISRIHKNVYAVLLSLVLIFYLSYSSFLDVDILGIKSINIY